MPYVIEYKLSGRDPHLYQVRRVFRTVDEAFESLNHFVHNICCDSDKGPGLELKIRWIDDNTFEQSLMKE